MKLRLFFSQFSCMLTSLLFLLIGCTPEVVSTANAVNAEETSLPAVTGEAVQPITETPTATAVRVTMPATVSVTPTSAPALTSVPTSTATPIMLSIITPTLLPEQAKSQIQGLFEDNGGCLLPCFWGFTLGETEWQTAQEFLEPIALQIYADDISAEVRLPAPPNNSNAIELRQSYTYEDGIITWIISPILQTLNFQPSTVLRTYGPPNEVWLLTANASREGYWRSILTLFYPQQGFILQYGGDNTQLNDKILGCEFEQTELILLGVWLPKEELTYQEVANRSVRFGETTYDLPLEEATGMSVATFYETFKDPANPICLETPLNLWPGP